jgi:drug/metabolite transporter (DMT)-like permease
MDRNKSYLAASLTTVIWGGSYISTKILVDVISPDLLVFYRFLISSVFLMILLKLREKKLYLNLADLPRFIFCSGIGYTAYFLLESNGIMLTNASISSIIIGMIPVLSLLTDVVFFKNRLTAVKIASVTMSFAGVLLVIGSPGSGVVNPLGIIFIFGAAVCWITFNYLNGPLYRRYSSLAITTWQTVIAFVSLFFIVMFKGESFTLNASLAEFSHILFLGIAASAGGFLFYIYALKHLGVLSTTLFVNFIPVTTMLTGRIFLGEVLSGMQWAGGLVIVLSLYIGSIFSAKESVKTLAENNKTG